MVKAPRVVPLVLFLIACALILPNLGDRRLWQDEAEAALVAKNILRTGLPLGWDGRLFVSQLSGREMTGSFLWAWTPWLMHYVAALGMAVSGEDAFGARWPFALLGCLSFPLFYQVTFRLSQDRSLSLLASALLLGSIQYLLLMRQCRYYALLPVLFFLALWGYDALPSKRGVTLLSLGLVGLFHSNQVSCAIVAMGFVLHAVLFRRREGVGIHLLVSGLFLAAGSVPWVLATGLLDRAPSRSGFGINLLGTLIMSNRYICPWLVLAGMGIAYLRKRFQPRPIDALCLCMLAPAFVFLPQFLWPNPRYVSFLLPVGAILLARAIREAHAFRPWLGFLLATVSAGSNVLVIPLPALLPAQIGRTQFDGGLETGADAVKLGWLRSELGGYVYELTHACRGPDEALVSFIEANTSPDDLIFITNDWLPVMFHTGRRLAGVASPAVHRRPGWGHLPSYLWDTTQARWFVLRPTGSNPRDRARMLAVFARLGIRVERTFYLDVDDVQWINRPMLSKHVFQPREGSSNGMEVWLLKRITRP